MRHWKSLGRRHGLYRVPLAYKTHFRAGWGAAKPTAVLRQKEKKKTFLYGSWRDDLRSSRSYAVPGWGGGTGGGVPQTKII